MLDFHDLKCKNEMYISNTGESEGYAGSPGANRQNENVGWADCQAVWHGSGH